MDYEIVHVAGRPGSREGSGKGGGGGGKQSGEKLTSVNNHTLLEWATCTDPVRSATRPAEGNERMAGEHVDDLKPKTGMSLSRAMSAHG
jgi:hypothetical protein